VFVGYFTERPYQDPDASWYNQNITTDLELSNAEYNPQLGSKLYNRYLDEKVYAEEMGFDGVMLNEHHSTPFCMGGVVNVEAAILARITQRAKIVIVGNVLPIWDDPLWLAESLATIDMISKGRLVTGWVRGGGRESVAHNAQPPFNWERFQEAHDLILKAWTEPGPFRWEGEHYSYRYVNPWMRPYQEPRPQIWIPGIFSRNTVKWAAEHRYPYVMLATQLEPTKASFDYYRQAARDSGYEAGTQNLGYLFKVHVDETEEKAYEVGRKFIEGPSNIYLEGSRSRINPATQNLPGLTSRTNVLPTADVLAVQFSRGKKTIREELEPEPEAASPEQLMKERNKVFDGLLDGYGIITGTPDTVIPKIRHVLEYLRPGNIFFWDGDGDMSHDDSMRSLRLMGEHVLPAVREMGKELGLKSAFEVDPYTGHELTDASVALEA
jgi:alkanesulfonate monooxygenase SsuD/methylene tetrahydromethanopterin reductase-like flavin-dependent oxidoreductase (luciferase family)